MNSFGKIRLYFAAGLLFLGASSAFGGAVLPSSTSCNTYSSFSVDSGGNLSIQCAGGGGTQIPSCSLTPTSQTINAGTSATLSASCANPNTFTWTNGGPTFSGAGGTQSFPNVGTYNYSINNGAGGSASAIITVQASSGGGGGGGGTCPANLKITDTALTASNKSQNIVTPSSPGMGHVFSFTTGAANTVLSIKTGEFGGYQSEKTAVVSGQRCDFDINSPTALAKTVQQRPTFDFTIGFAYAGYTQLAPNTTYYMNLKNEDRNGYNTCPDNCQFTLVHSTAE